MYHAFNKPYVWSEGYYFFTFPSQQACDQFKHAVSTAGIGTFHRTPVWGDGDSEIDNPLTRYKPEACVRWGYTIRAFTAAAGPRGQMNGDWVDNLVSNADSRYYLRIHVPGLDERDPYWNRLVAKYR